VTEQPADPRSPCPRVGHRKTRFTVPNPNCTSQRRRLFQVWLSCRLPRLTDHPVYFGSASFISLSRCCYRAHACCSTPPLAAGCTCTHARTRATRRDTRQLERTHTHALCWTCKHVWRCEMVHRSVCARAHTRMRCALRVHTQYASLDKYCGAREPLNALLTLTRPSFPLASPTRCSGQSVHARTRSNHTLDTARIAWSVPRRAAATARCAGREAKLGSRQVRSRHVSLPRTGRHTHVESLRQRAHKGRAHRLVHAL